MPLNPTEVTKLRKEIETEKNKDNAVEEIARKDPKSSIPVIIAILEEIKQKTEIHFRENVKELTAKEMNSTFENFYSAYVEGSDPVTVFESYTGKMKREDLTEEKLSEIYASNIDKINRAVQVVIENKERQGLFNKQLKVLFFLCQAIFLYKAIDDLQNLNVFTKLKMVTKALSSVDANEDNMRKKWLITIFTSKQVLENDETRGGLWAEVALWMEGLYWHAYHAYPKEYKNEKGEVTLGTDKKFPSVPKNDNDEKFKKYYGMTAYDVALYHRSIADNIVKQLKVAFKFDQSPDSANMPDIQKVSAENLTKNVPAEAIEVNFSEQSDRVNEENVKQTDSPIVVLSEVKTDLVLKPTQESNMFNLPVKEHIQTKEINSGFVEIKIIVRKEMESPIIRECERLMDAKKKRVDDTIISAELERYKDATSQEKFIHLEYCIKQYELTPAQQNLLDFVSDKLLKAAAVYSNAFKSYIYHRPHEKEAKMLQEKVAIMSDRREQLQELFKIKACLGKDDSKDLLPSIEEVLLIAFDRLRKGPLLFENKKVI